MGLSSQEVIELNSRVIHSRVLVGQASLAVLRVNGAQRVWATMGGEDHDDSIYEILFKTCKAKELQPPINSPEEIASLGLLTLSLDPKFLLYYPAITAAIMPESFTDEHQYRFDSSFHEFTKSLISGMLKDGMRISIVS